MKLHCPSNPYVTLASCENMCNYQIHGKNCICLPFLCEDQVVIWQKRSDHAKSSKLLSRSKVDTSTQQPCFFCRIVPCIIAMYQRHCYRLFEKTVSLHFQMTTSCHSPMPFSINLSCILYVKSCCLLIMAVRTYYFASDNYAQMEIGFSKHLLRYMQFRNAYALHRIREQPSATDSENLKVTFISMFNSVYQVMRF